MFRGGSSRSNSTRGSTFRGRSRGGGARGRGGGPARTGGPKGLFADGIWQCNCAPRLPAEHFKVKKEGKNQGRWFYTCQNSEPRRCDFFLWDEDAKLREEGAVLGNSRSEPANRRVTGAQEGWDAGRSRPREGIFAGINPGTGRIQNATAAGEDDESTEDESPPPEYSSQPAGGGSKRSANAAGLDDDDDEAFPWPLTGQEEEEMADIADAAAVNMPQTPRKAAKTGVYATPVATTQKKTRILPWAQEPSTAAPVTPNTPAQPRASYFDTPSKPPANHLPPIPEQTGPATPTLHPPTPALPPKSPSPPTKYHNALSNPADSTSTLTHDALACLASVSIPDEALSRLRGVLTKHDLRTQGVVKGRGITRLGLKAKDAKIAELQARIASLEAEREVDRGVIRSLRWKGEHNVVGSGGEDGEDDDVDDDDDYDYEL